MCQVKYNRKTDTNKQSNMQEENYNSFQAHTKQNIGNDNDNDDASAQNLLSCFLLCGVIHPFQFIQISKENLSNIMDHFFSLQTRESGYEEISLRKN